MEIMEIIDQKSSAWNAPFSSEVGRAFEAFQFHPTALPLYS